MQRRLYCFSELLFSLASMILSIYVFYTFFNYNDSNSVYNQHKEIVQNW